LKLTNFYEAAVEQIINPVIENASRMSSEQLNFFEASFSIVLSWQHEGDFRKLIRDERAVEQISAALQKSVRELVIDANFPANVRLMIDAFCENNSRKLNELCGDVPPIFRGRETMEKYLAALKNIANRYVLILAAKDTFGNNLDKNSRKLLSEIGVKNSLATGEESRRSFVAVIDEGWNIYEKIGATKTAKDIFLAEIRGVKIDVKSAPFGGGNFAKIIIDGIDFAMNLRGINLVIYDKYSGTVVDSVAFDTFRKNVPLSRQAIINV
jgi:hypothetical protein